MLLRTHVRPMVTAVMLIGLAAYPRIAAGQETQKIGAFQWDKTTGEVRLQRPSSEQLLVQVMVITASETGGGSWKSRPLPTAAMEAWVLLEDGKTLEQTPRQPPNVAPPIGVGNAGTTYSFVNFGFKSSREDKIVAVVVKIENEFHTFPTHGTER